MVTGILRGGYFHGIPGICGEIMQRFSWVENPVKSMVNLQWSGAKVTDFKGKMKHQAGTTKDFVFGFPNSKTKFLVHESYKR